MTEDIHRLVYYSRNRLTGSADVIADNITTILATSRENNARVGATGALMFNAGCFAQMLEGPAGALETVFERIQNDDRHGDVSLLAFGPVSTRAFEAWSMGFVGRSVADAARYGPLVEQSGFDPSRMDGEAIFETLRQLAVEEETYP